MDAHESDMHDLASELISKFPQNTKPLENQVAGHSFQDGRFTVGMLKDEEGYVLKPVNKPELGMREMMFYETVATSLEEKVKQLKQFVPEYYGSSTLTINGISTQFLKLTDATRGYNKPCVMDVKMGKQTWEPGAPLKKQQKEEAKYRLCKQEYGFCIPGFQVYNVLNGTVEKRGKEYTKSLTKENIPEVLKKFLNCGSGRSKAVGEEILKQLNNILAWWRSQHIYHMYSSSVLLTYDAEMLRTTGELLHPMTILTGTKTTPCVHVLLIDFAHVVPANNTLDLNYLHGLENFVQIFTDVINEL